ncbi:TetR/AcrR family transcriptional regulator [Streptomyces nodosus]|uniref:TetR family transcriptional regulator n=1 Tax=Streptomyces nodosus TaxID=40318 RepID=A0A0B5DQW8_9ACTN|nr:TetR family transcriptional regulator [Streptomyces nodosus]QEV41477.1 TetR/AcrR family transcriptional regulator [Streptomyces nodosus]
MLQRVEPRRDNTGNRRGRRSREEILEVASRLMAERGYAATTLSELSRESGLPKSAVYHHFRSKGGLLSAVMEHGAYAFFQHMARAQQHPPREGSARERLGWYLRRTGEVFLANPDFLRLHLILVMNAEAAEAAEVERIIERVRRDGRAHMNHMIADSFAEYGPEIAQTVADRLDYFAIAGFDGAFVAWQADPSRSMAEAMDLLTDAVAALGESMAAGLRP